MYKFELVSYLEKDLTKKIINLQKEIAKTTNTYDAIDSWKPHLTIGSGIMVKKKDLEILYDKINSIILNHKCFKININGYGFVDSWQGENPNEPNCMINLKVEKNKKLLKLVFDVENIVNNYEPWYRQPNPYEPHITLGYGFSKTNFEKAKRIFKGREFLEKSIINNFSLALKNEKGEWKCFKKFFLIPRDVTNNFPK